MELSENFELIEYTPFSYKLTCIIHVIFMFVEYQVKKIVLHTKIALLEK